MHPNPSFRAVETQENIAFARERGFGTLAVSISGEVMLSHIPFLIAEDGRSLELHLVRSNPIARALRDPLKATIAVSGADSYISPDWYGIEDQVPTWNYVAVHLKGEIEPLPQDALPALLGRLSAHFEQMLAPKPEWTQDKMSPEALTKMMRMIQPFRMSIADVQGTWKLGQNKPDDVRTQAADFVAGYGLGNETRLLAALMHSPTGKMPS